MARTPVDIDLRSYITDDSTPSAQMLFTVANPQNGTVTLLADGYTARFTPTPGYTGVPSFTFTATDAGGNADTMLVWDFDLPDGTATNVAVDASGKGRDGTIDFAAAGTYSLVTRQTGRVGATRREVHRCRRGRHERHACAACLHRCGTRLECR